MNKTQYDKLIEWNNELLQNYIVNDIFLVVYIVLGILGNAIVIINYSFRMKRNKDDRYFIPHLAVLDLMACVFRSSLELAMNLNPVNFRGRILCKLFWLPTNVFAIASIFLLLVIAVQRYLKICRPFGVQMTIFWKRFALCSCIISAIVFAIPLLLYNEEIKVTNPVNNVTGYVCDIDVKRYYGTGFITYTMTASFTSLVIMIFLTILNILIGRTIYHQIKAKHMRKVRQNSDAQSMRSFMSRAKMNIAPDVSEYMSETDGESQQKTCMIACTQRNKTQTNSLNKTSKSGKMTCSHRYSFMFMAIGVAFILSYVPRLIMLVISLYDPKFFGKISDAQLALVAFSREMNVVNNVVNPFIYGFFDGKFRNETKKLLCRQ